MVRGIKRTVPRSDGPLASSGTGRETSTGQTHTHSGSTSRVPETPPHTGESSTGQPILEREDLEDIHDDSDEEPDLESEQPLEPPTPLEKRTHIRLVGKWGLYPDKGLAKCIGDIITYKLSPRKFIWKDVPNELKKQHFLELEKYYVWDDSIHGEVKRRFTSKASIRYSGRIANWKKEYQISGKKPETIAEEDWPAWKAHWASKKQKDISEQASKNRMSEKIPGAGPSRHFNGSQSFTERGIQMAKDLKRDPTAYEIFCKTKTRDGEFMDIRSQKLHDVVEKHAALLGEAGATAGAKQSIFLEINPPCKKQRIYGLGDAADCWANAFRGSSIPHSLISEDSSMEERVEEIVAERLSEKERQMEDRFEQQKAEMKDQMELQFSQLIAKFQTQMMPQAPPQ